MNSTFRLPTSLLAGAVVVALVSTSGCHWVRSKFSNHDDYTKSQESRPLEVPPDLNAPDTSNAMAIPPANSLGSTSASSEAGFIVDGAASDNWAKIGAILDSTPEVTVNGRAEALNSYDVRYQGQNFLIRVEDFSGQSHVFAISNNGQILRAGPASILLPMIKAKL